MENGDTENVAHCAITGAYLSEWLKTPNKILLRKYVYTFNGITFYMHTYYIFKYIIFFLEQYRMW